MSKLMLSVVVPCFNEQDGIFELSRRVTEACKKAVDKSYELILVNDGSNDATWEKMCEISRSDGHVTSINLSRNYGHQIALSAGLRFCKGDRIFIIDADLQDPPELLSKMMLQMDEGCDVVYGQRNKREGETAFKKASAFAFYRILNWFVDINIPKDTGDFRLISRKAVEVLNSMPEQHRFIRGMVSWIGMRQEPIFYDREPRFAGKTKYPLTKMIKFAIDAITGFSILPLRFATWFGVFTGLLAVALLFFVVIENLLGNTIEGWTSLALIILSLGSIQLFVTGVLGEYLGRIYIESKGRPLYVIQEILNSDNIKTIKIGS
jgi:dolichol-phosphate mannosyltransferase